MQVGDKSIYKSILKNINIGAFTYLNNQILLLVMIFLYSACFYVLLQTNIIFLQ